MGITTTLENISQKFKEWHSDTDKNGQHDRIYEEIRRQSTTLDDKIVDNNKKNNILARAIQKIIDNREINNVDSLNLGSINLNSLQEQINRINNKFGIPNDATVKDYIDNVNAQHDDGARYYNKIINDTLILKDIPAQANLNTYTDIGIYRCTSKNIASSLSNSPVTNSSFILITLSQYKNEKYNDGYIDGTTRNSIIRQIIFQNHSNNNGDTTTKNDGYRIYQRYYQVGGGLWNEWTELYGTHNTQLVTMKVEFSNNNTQDYILLTKK